MPSQLATGLRVCLSAWCAVCLAWRLQRSAWLVCLFVCLRGGLLNFRLRRPSRREGRFSRLCRSLGIAFCSSLVHYVPYCTYRGALADREPNVLANRGMPGVTGVTDAHAGVVFGVLFGVQTRTHAHAHKRSHAGTNADTHTCTSTRTMGVRARKLRFSALSRPPLSSSLKRAKQSSETKRLPR
jgi:hypothetical protein